MSGTINIGVLAHVDAGKTTTVEQMLYQTGAIQAPGSIEKGNTQTDFLEVERKRGISVRASAASFMLDGVRVNIIDTPGHMDFTGEVERALLALDAVILVVSAMEGVQSQTEVFWKAIRALKLPTILFMNKIDRMGCDPDAVLAAIRETLSPSVVALNAAAGVGTKDCGVSTCALSEDDMFVLAEQDEALADKLLSGGAVRAEDWQEAVGKGVRRGAVFPLVYGAAAQGVGVEALLEAVQTYFPRQPEDNTEALSAIVYKIEHDANLGKIAHVRMFAGAMQNKDMVMVRRGGESFTEKINQIYFAAGNKREDKGVLKSGQVGAVCGLGGARTGDVIGERRLERYCPIATTLFSVELKVDAPQMPALMKAVTELSDEDPLLDYKWAPDERELYVQIMGPIQMEIIDSLLRSRYNLVAAFSSPTVIYKETPSKAGVGFEAYTMPKPCWAILKLEITPLPRGAGYRFDVAEGLRNEKLNERYRHHIEQCLPGALKQGVYNWEVVDLHVRLVDGEHHIYHTHPLDFFLATPLALLDGLTNCGTTLLEPMLQVQMEAEESLSGKLIGEVMAMRGMFESPVIRNGRLWMEARVPVATSREFPIRFAALTSGKGQYKSRFDGYQECPIELGEAAKRRGVDPRDRAKWILHKRSAI